MAEASNLDKLIGANAIMHAALVLARAEIDATRQANEKMFAFAAEGGLSQDPVRKRRTQLEEIIGKIDEGLKLVEIDYAIDEAAMTAKRITVAAMSLDDDCPGLWIGFKTEDDRKRAIALFDVEASSNV